MAGNSEFSRPEPGTLSPGTNPHDATPAPPPPSGVLENGGVPEGWTREQAEAEADDWLARNDVPDEMPADTEELYDDPEPAPDPGRELEQRAQDAGQELERQVEPAREPAQGEMTITEALAVLQLDGVPSEVLKSSSDEQLLTWAAKRQRTQRDVALAFDERARLRRQLETAEPAGPGEAQPAPNPAPELDAQLGAFSELYGDEGAAALKSVVGAVSQSFEAELSALRGQLGEVLQERGAERAEVIRARLGERFPGLADPRQFHDVQQRMQLLQKTGEYQGRPDVLMEDAARLAGLTEKAASSRTRTTPTPPTRRSGQNGAKKGLGPDASVEDRDQAALDWLEENRGDVAGARAVSGWHQSTPSFAESQRRAPARRKR